MKKGIVPPTINLENPDLESGCDLDYVPNVAHHYTQEEIPTAILSDNLGFGELSLMPRFYVAVYYSVGYYGANNLMLSLFSLFLWFFRWA